MPPDDEHREAEGPVELQRRLASRLREIREQRGLTQEEVAHSAGMAPRHIQKIEAGEVNVTLRTIARLCRALQVEAAELLEQPPEAR